MEIPAIRDRIELRGPVQATRGCPVSAEASPTEGPSVPTAPAASSALSATSSSQDGVQVSGVVGCPFGPRLTPKTRVLSIQGRVGAETAACQSSGPTGAPLLGQLNQLRNGLCPFLSQQMSQTGQANPQLESLLSQLRSGQLDSVQFFEKVRQECGLSVQLGQARIETTPILVQQIMATTEENFAKSPLQQQALEPVYGSDNIFVTGQSQWKERRTLLSPFFDPRHVFNDHTHQSIVEKVTHHLDRWSSGSQPVDLSKEMPKLTLDAAVTHMFSVQLSDDELTKAVELFQASGDRVGERLVGVEQPDSSSDSAIESGLGQLAERLLRGRESTAQLEAHGQPVPQDMLQVLLDRFADSPGELRQEVLSLALLGHETTANLINWTLAELDEHPQVVASMRAEIDSVVGNQAPSLEAMKSLKSPRINLSETWRLHPPNNLMLREALKDVTLDDGQGGQVVLPKGTQVLMPLSVVNSETENGHLWDPQRPGSKVFSFGGGQRVCMGQVFARHEAAVIVSEIVRRFDFHSTHTDLTPLTGFATGPTAAFFQFPPRATTPLDRQPESQ